MINARFHPEGPGSDAAPARPGEAGGRLNLLLSYAGRDDESWVDLVPPILEPLGVYSLLAGTGRQASEVITRYPIHIAVVDLGLPLDATAAAGREAEEGGPRLLELLRRLETPPPMVVVKRARSHRDDSREIAAALRAGAFAVIDRPKRMNDVEVMLEVLRRCLLRFYSGRWPGPDPLFHV